MTQTIEDRQYKSFVKQGGQWHRRTLESKDANIYSNMEVVKTTVSTTALRVDTLENSGNFYLIHKNTGQTLYIGDENVTTGTGFPLSAGEVLTFENMQKDNNNEIYAIGSTDIELFCAGVYK